MGAAERTLAAHGAIGLSLCLGAYYMLAEPARRALEETRAAVLDRQAKLVSAESLRDTLPRVTADLARVRAEAEAITAAGRLARDEGELFAAVTSIAEAHRVRVDQLDPLKSDRGVPRQGGAASARGDISLAYNMTIMASYPDIAAFVNALQTELGHARVRSVQITPTTDMVNRTVRAVIQTELMAFDASPVLAGASDGQGG